MTKITRDMRDYPCLKVRLRRPRRRWQRLKSRKLENIIVAKPKQGGHFDSDGNGMASDGYHYQRFKNGYVKIVPEAWCRPIIYGDLAGLRMSENLELTGKDDPWHEFFEKLETSNGSWDDFFKNAQVSEDFMTSRDQPSPHIGSSFDDFLKEEKIFDEVTQTASERFFAERAKNADIKKARELLARSGGGEVRGGDELPEDWDTDNPFATFNEWDTEADRLAYGSLPAGSYSGPPIHPSEHLQDRLDHLPSTPERFAKETGIDLIELEKFLLEKSGITDELAEKLSAYFDCTVGYWRNLQKGYDRRISELQEEGRNWTKEQYDAALAEIDGVRNAETDPLECRRLDMLEWKVEAYEIKNSCKRVKYRLQDLLDGITDENQQEFIDDGGPVGEEKI